MKNTSHSDKRYWLWLQMCLGEGALFKEIIEEFGSVEKLYNSNILEWRMSSSLTSKQIDNLQKYKLNDTERIIYDCENNNWNIITFDDEKYPDRLREIDNPPAVLYVDGKMPDFDNLVSIGMVGTRKASSYAIKVTHIMSKAVGLCGAVVVSGGALGVDTAAHKGALSADAQTVAVLGCGLGASYLNENKALRSQIKDSGALISEYPPFTGATRYTFPMRNRIISGLSLGVLVVEAGVKSGSLITARYANEQGRDVFAVPSSILDVNFAGTNKLIDDGAVVATSPMRLLEGYCETYGHCMDISKMKTVRELLFDDRDKGANLPEKKQVSFDSIVKDRKQRVEKEQISLSLKGDEKLVFDLLDDSFITIDTLIEKSNLESKRVLIALTMLEMKGIVKSASGKRYRKG